MKTTHNLPVCNSIPPCLLKSDPLTSARHQRRPLQTCQPNTPCLLNLVSRSSASRGTQSAGPISHAPHLFLSVHFPCNPLPCNHLPKRAVQHHGVLYRGPLRKQEDCDRPMYIFATEARHSVPLGGAPRGVLVRFRLGLALRVPAYRILTRRTPFQGNMVFDSRMAILDREAAFMHVSRRPTTIIAVHKDQQPTRAGLCKTTRR